MSAGPEVKAKIVADDQTKAGFDSSLKGAQTFGDKLKETLNKPFELLKGLLAVEMVRVVGEFFKSSVEAAAESEAAWGRVGQAVQNAGITFQAVQGDLKDTFATISEQSRYSQDQIASAFAEVLNVSNNYQGSLKNLSLITNIAAAKQIDLTTAAQLVGRVMDGNTSMLKRYGIVVKDGQDAMEAMRAQFAGFADRDGATLQGRLAQINNAWNDVKIALGEAMTGMDGAGAGTNTLRDALVNLGKWIETNRDSIHQFAEDLGKIVGFTAKASVAVISSFSNNIDDSPFTIGSGGRAAAASAVTDDPAYKAYQAALKSERARVAAAQIAANAKKAKQDADDLAAKARDVAEQKHIDALKQEGELLVQARDILGLSAKDYDTLGELQYKLLQLEKDTNTPLKERVAIHEVLQKMGDADQKRAAQQLKDAEAIAAMEAKGNSIGAISDRDHVAGANDVYDEFGGLGVKGILSTGGFDTPFHNKNRIDGRATAAALPTSGAGAAPINDDFQSFSREIRGGAKEAVASLADVETSFDSLGRTIGTVGGGALTDFFGNWQQGIADVIAGHESLSQAIVSSAKKAIGQSMAAEGQATLLKAAAAAAEGLFNPGKFVQAGELFAAGSAELAFASLLSGGASGGASTSSGGSVSPAGFSQTQNQVTGGKATVVLKGKGINFKSAEDLDALAAALRELGETRELSFIIEGT